MRYLRAIFDFLLYTNLWLAAAALAMAAQTQLLLSGRMHPTPLLGFVFFSTLLLYAIHRLVGLKKLGGAPSIGRYEKIAVFKKALNALVPAAAALACFWFLELHTSVKLAAIWPSLIALAYVIPLWRGRRLRDLHYIKIFLIAAAWSWITVYLPAVELGMRKNIPMLAIALERLFFIFALTLPFDIRDLDADRRDGVKTIPGRLGIRRTKWLALACLLAVLALAALNHHIDVYSTAHFAALALSALATGSLIASASTRKSDYFYSGAIDGMMILQPFLIWLAQIAGPHF
jgi:4-hydroxybenzoate polyprenyltransferase